MTVSMKERFKRSQNLILCLRVPFYGEKQTTEELSQTMLCLQLLLLIKINCVY